MWGMVVIFDHVKLLNSRITLLIWSKSYVAFINVYNILCTCLLCLKVENGIDSSSNVSSLIFSAEKMGYIFLLSVTQDTYKENTCIPKKEKIKFVFISSILLPEINICLVNL